MSAASDAMNLTEEDIQFCQKAFSEYDEEGLGAIKVSDLKMALENIGFPQTEDFLFKMISEVDEKNTGFIRFSDFLAIYYKNKYANASNDDQDLVDAFVAMGGEADQSGSVDADLLIKIIKEEFEMTINIEDMIRKIDKDGSGEIEFDEFKELLQSRQNND